MRRRQSRLPRRSRCHSRFWHTTRKRTSLFCAFFSRGQRGVYSRDDSVSFWKSLPSPVSLKVCNWWTVREWYVVFHWRYSGVVPGNKAKTQKKDLRQKPPKCLGYVWGVSRKRFGLCLFGSTTTYGTYGRQSQRRRSSTLTKTGLLDIHFYTSRERPYERETKRWFLSTL